MRIKKNGDGWEDKKVYDTQDAYVCETEPLPERPHCVAESNNFLVIERNTTNDAEVTNVGVDLWEVDLYEGEDKLSGSSLSFYLSSESGSNTASKCAHFSNSVMQAMTNITTKIERDCIVCAFGCRERNQKSE